MKLRGHTLKKMGDMRGDSGGEAAGLRRRGNHKGAGGQVTGTARVGSGEAPKLIANDVSK
jgi:ribosomal protein L4